MIGQLAAGQVLGNPTGSTALPRGTTIAGLGGVVGPATSTTGDVAVFNNATGTLLAVGTTTGTGSIVRANSPTLAAPVLAGAIASGVWSGTALTLPAFTMGGTINGGGNLISSAIIGSTTPLAGYFTIVNIGAAIAPDSTLTVNNNTAAVTGTLPVGTIAHLIGANATTARVLIDAFAGVPVLAYRRANGTALGPTALIPDDTIGQFNCLGYGTSSYSSTSRASVLGRASQTWTDSAQGTYISVQLTPNGSTTIAESVRFQNSGGVSIGTTTDPGIGCLLVATSITPTNIVGTVTNNNAATGSVGEFISTTIPIASAVVATTAVAFNVSSISLTAGDWDCWGAIGTNPATTTVQTQILGWISTTSATFPNNINNGAVTGLAVTFAAGQPQYMPVGRARFSLSTTTPVFLSIFTTFTTNTNGGFGFIGARRVR